MGAAEGATSGGRVSSGRVGAMLMHKIFDSQFFPIVNRLIYFIGDIFCVIANVFLESHNLSRFCHK